VHTAKAVHHFRAVAKALMIPVYATWNAIDIATDEDFWCGGRVGTYGGKGRNFGIQNSDLLLIVGSRISGRITGGNPKSFARGAKKYLVEIDKALCNSDWQPVKTDENLNADVNMFLARMIYATKDGSPSHTQWVSDCRLLSHHYDPVNPEFCVRNDIVHPYAFLRLLSRLIPSNSIVVGDCGGNIVALMHAFETKPGQRVFSNNGNSPMGFSFAAAMGAWFADPSRPVYCIIGDGGMNMNIQELQTMKNYGVKVKTFIINNHIYGITKAYQKTNFHGRAEACGPKGYKPPNFIDIAEAYGAYTYVLEANKSSVDGGRWEEELRAALRFENDGPMVIDVECHDFHTYEPRIVGWQTPIEDLYPYLPREEFKANMQIETDPISENPPMPQVL
jgi:acetolactate synthase-1/2/3 large subunit